MIDNNCSTAEGTADYSCSINAKCMDSPSRRGHVCKCLPGYEGNGYSNGTACTDIDECLDDCVEPSKGGVCLNLPGSYNCSCAKKGYTGDGFKNGSVCESESSNKFAMFAAIGSVSAFVGTSLGACGIVWLLRTRYLKHARDEYFRSNGAVAIKKFKEIPIGVESEESVNQFINEMLILSGLNHKNVVSLVGCCLQTQSPLLVYEFVDGGTISHQLHSGRLFWQSRLQIAMGSAEALAYLHSELDHPIIHRDVKSTNILLANTITPKIADFGISRLLCGNDTHLTTNIMGTCGSMDPEYFDTGAYRQKRCLQLWRIPSRASDRSRTPLSRKISTGNRVI
ncbi:hypothetical protein SUGI_0459360 [Cryptomeria japonica]|nr:hypothetical protein SUGI_0459360 [Cryptomeria japonica]